MLILCFRYPVTEMKYLNAKMAEQYSVSAAAIATENLSTLRQPGSQLEPAALRLEHVLQNVHACVIMQELFMGS